VAAAFGLGWGLCFCLVIISGGEDPGYWMLVEGRGDAG